MASLAATLADSLATNPFPSHTAWPLVTLPYRPLGFVTVLELSSIMGRWRWWCPSYSSAARLRDIYLPANSVDPMRWSARLGILLELRIESRPRKSVIGLPAGGAQFSSFG